MEEQILIEEEIMEHNNIHLADGNANNEEGIAVRENIVNTYFLQIL